MLHLAVLIANPGQEVDAVDLAAGLSAVESGTDQPVLDRAAVREYQNRLAQLRREIEILEAGGRPDHAAKARAERDWLTAELAAATGFGGRSRAFPSNREPADRGRQGDPARTATRRRGRPGDRRAPGADRAHRYPLRVPAGLTRERISRPVGTVVP